MGRRDEIAPGRLLEFLKSFFPDRIMIRKRTEGSDSTGQPLEEYDTVYQNIACRIAPAKGDEKRTDALTYSVGRFVISTMGCYNVTPAMQAVDEKTGVVYGISDSTPDSLDMTTHISAEVVR